MTKTVSKIVGQKKVYKMLELAADHDMPALLIGHTGCLHPATMIYDPTDKTNLMVKTRAESGKPLHVYALDEHGRVVVAEAEAPKPYTKEHMYTFTLDNGSYLNSITVTAEHRFYIGNGQYATASDLLDVLHASGEVRLPSISARALSESFVDAQRSSRTAVDFPAGYLPLPRLYGQQPQLAEDSGPELVPPQGDARERNQLLLHGGDLENKPENNRQYPGSDRLSMPNSESPSGSSHDHGLANQARRDTPAESSASRPVEVQSGAYSSLADTAPRPEQSFDLTNVSYVDNGDTDMLSCKVVGITEVEPEVYYDFHVPTYENYWAAGIFNHNTGKTSIVQDIANCRGQAWTRFNLTGDTTVDEFVGKYTLAGGETVWEDGILLQAMKKGDWLIIDEINVALPEILFALHSLLDDDKFVVVASHQGETVRPHENFRLFATMNPVEEYAGTKELNKAFMSRFNVVMEMEYPPKKDEVNIVHQHTGIDKLEAAKMVDVAIRIRDAKKKDSVFYTCSTRDLIHWAKVAKITDIETGFTVSVLHKALNDRLQLVKIYDSTIARYNALDKAAGEAQELTIDWFEQNLQRINEHETTFEQRVQDGIKAKLAALV